MGKKTICLFLIICLFCGCAGYHAHYQPIGKISNIKDYEQSVLVAPEEIDIYVQEYPEGFIYEDGIISVVEGSKNKILGEINITPKQGGPMMGIVGMLSCGLMYPFLIPSRLRRERAIILLQKRASAQGANAVIGVKLSTYFASGVAAIIMDK